MKLRFASPLLALSLFGATAPLCAQDATTDEDTLYVWGRREAGIGVATSASEGLVSFGAFADRPLLRTGELAEVVPGVAVTQHSGSGKANQYFLRGFNLDHGTDFSASFEGVPLNLRSNAHGQGYLDLNILVPELIDSIRYRKGPYYTDVGDFSAAGAVGFHLLDRLPESFVTVTAGQYGYGRVLGATSLGADAYGALDVTAAEGPWRRDEDLRRANLLLHGLSGAWSWTAAAYAGRWSSTDQVPLRAVEAGTLPRLGTVDPTDGGRTSRLLLSLRHDGEDGVTGGLWLQRYALRLWSNFTYFLDDPVNGDQFEQAENRWALGGDVAKRWSLDDAWSLIAGGDLRGDRIGKIGLYRTRARELLSTDREDRVMQGSVAAHAEAAYDGGPIRATFGVRADRMQVNVTSSNRRNSGLANDTIVSPKATFAWRASPSVELYADAGRGYHSNDARGAVATVSPVSLEPVEAVPLYVPATGAELGARYEAEGFKASLALWGLKLDSELVYSGDAGDTESTHASRRLGIEALLNWTPIRGVNVDFSAATTRARYRDTAPGEDRIPNALQYVLTGGVSLALGARSSAEVTFRRLGPASLIEDDSVRSRASTLTNLLYRYNFERASLFAEVLNVFDRKDQDITYYYASRLPGEPADGVDDIHVHPMEPRTLRVGLKVVL